VSFFNYDEIHNEFTEDKRAVIARHSFAFESQQTIPRLTSFGRDALKKYEITNSNQFTTPSV
jgi:hypothetical protein